MWLTWLELDQPLQFPFHVAEMVDEKTEEAFAHQREVQRKPSVLHYANPDLVGKSVCRNALAWLVVNLVCRAWVGETVAFLIQSNLVMVFCSLHLFSSSSFAILHLHSRFLFVARVFFAQHHRGCFFFGTLSFPLRPQHRWCRSLRSSIGSLSAHHHTGHFRASLLLLLHSKAFPQNVEFGCLVACCIFFFFPPFRNSVCFVYKAKLLQ